MHTEMHISLFSPPLLLRCQRSHSVLSSRVCECSIMLGGAKYVRPAPYVKYISLPPNDSTQTLGKRELIAQFDHV